MILDVDPGHDDALALMLACGAPELEVRAFTTVAGNVSLPKTTRNALRVLSLIGRGDVPVGAGADAPLVRPLHTTEDVHGESGLDGSELAEPTFGVDGRGAARLIAEVLEASAEAVTLVPTGPLTNIATFLTEHPRLKEKIDRIVLMGGSIGPGNTTPAAEFNIHVDPEAARAVSGSWYGHGHNRRNSDGVRDFHEYRDYPPRATGRRRTTERGAADCGRVPGATTHGRSDHRPTTRRTVRRRIS